MKNAYLKMRDGAGGIIIIYAEGGNRRSRIDVIDTFKKILDNNNINAGLHRDSKRSNPQELEIRVDSDDRRKVGIAVSDFKWMFNPEGKRGVNELAGSLSKTKYDREFEKLFDKYSKKNDYWGVEAAIKQKIEERDWHMKKDPAKNGDLDKKFPDDKIRKIISTDIKHKTHEGVFVPLVKAIEKKDMEFLQKRLRHDQKFSQEVFTLVTGIDVKRLSTTKIRAKLKAWKEGTLEELNESSLRLIPPSKAGGGTGDLQTAWDATIDAVQRIPGLKLSDADWNYDTYSRTKQHRLTLSWDVTKGDSKSAIQKAEKVLKSALKDLMPITFNWTDGTDKHGPYIYVDMIW